MCKSIAACYPYNKHIDIEDCGHIHDMRAAYNLAIEHMSQWIEENGYEYVTYYDYYGCQSNFSQMITDFKKAMRPQGMVELDQSNKEDNQ